MSVKNKLHLTVLGVHVKSDGYPNVTWRLKSILETQSIDVQEICFPFRPTERAGSVFFKNKPLRTLAGMIRLIYSHCRLIVAYLSQKPFDTAYVPYPAVFVLFAISLMPSPWRPRFLMADAFISIYDTLVNDREMVAKGGLIACLIRKLETQAYHAADRIIVDTELNADFFSRTFCLPSTKLKVLPLSTNPEAFRFSPYHPPKSNCNVLFIGTFVPLQGVETIARAILLLSDSDDIHFTLIGTGQTALAVRSILATGSGHVEWLEDWHTSRQLADRIQQADICLGIFGTGEKTQRVWPLKNYAYLSVGRAIITGDTDCAKALSKLSNDPLFVSVPVGDPIALAEAILKLSKDEALRCELSSTSQAFFQGHLNNQIAVDYIIAQLSRE